MKSYDITNYGLFDTPHKAVWSEYHQGLFVLGRHSVSLMIDGSSRLIQASDIHSFVDLSVSDDGQVLLVLDQSARLLDPDLNRIIREVHSETMSFVTGVVVGPAQFLVGGIDSVAPSGSTSSSESTVSSPGYSSSTWLSGVSSSSSTTSSSSAFTVRWYRFFVVGEETTSDTIQCIGHLISVLWQPGWDDALSIFSSGDVLSVNLLNGARSSSSEEQVPTVKLMKNIGSGVSAAAAGPNLTTIGAGATQTRVRVYVGSQPWQADRWDSGAVATNKTAILYGGGDNLEPGQPYWVHIATYHPESGWSAPAIQRFLVPKE